MHAYTRRYGDESAATVVGGAVWLVPILPGFNRLQSHDLGLRPRAKQRGLIPRCRSSSQRSIFVMSGSVVGEQADDGRHGTEQLLKEKEEEEEQQQQQAQAAQVIQRNYRGYRERRQLRGMGLDANARWSEVCAEPHVPLGSLDTNGHRL